VARFSFADLCEKPLAASDYLRLAHDYHTIMVDRIPVMDYGERNAAKRFITLIDTLYDNAVKLMASAAADPLVLAALPNLDPERASSLLAARGGADFDVAAALGDLDRISRCVRLGGFINVAPGFSGVALVMNGASDLIVEILGDKGRHARSTIGVAELPLDSAVEVEALFEIAP